MGLGLVVVKINERADFRAGGIGGSFRWFLGCGRWFYERANSERSTDARCNRCGTSTNRDVPQDCNFGCMRLGDGVLRWKVLGDVDLMVDFGTWIM
jgi:hypothetical protein